MSRSYAVGDVHGRDDLLGRALHRIRRVDPSGLIVILGDYVDRGPDSRAVVDRLMAEDQAGRLIALKGNHDKMMVDAVRNGDVLQMSYWTDNGGDATLKSYGCRDIAPEELLKIPSGHIRWLDQRPLYHLDPYRLYVHAGIEPGKTLEGQNQRALLWIRGRFFDADPAELAIDHVVHGHTPHSLPERLQHRTNIDTGAYLTGVLTVGVFDDDRPGGPIDVWSIDV